MNNIFLKNKVVMPVLILIGILSLMVFIGTGGSTFFTFAQTPPSDPYPSVTAVMMPRGLREWVIDNKDQSGFGVINQWSTASNQGFFGDLRFSSSYFLPPYPEQSYAIFKIRVDPGRYKISTTWVEHSNRATNVPYDMYDGNTIKSRRYVNQEYSPGDSRHGNEIVRVSGVSFLTIGTVIVDSGLLSVVISNEANEYVIADAVRIECMSGCVSEPPNPPPPNPNQPPTMNTIGNRFGTAGNPLTFTITGYDPEGSPLTCSGSNLPTGALLSGCAFSWTPTTSQVGNHTITFSMSDGSLTDSETISINVVSDTNQCTILYRSTELQKGVLRQVLELLQGLLNVPPPTNQPPTLDPIGNRTIVAGNNLSFSIVGSDPERLALTCSASVLPTGATLIPQPPEENESICLFSWTPTASQVGNNTITFSMSDGSLTDSETITIAVNAAGGGSSDLYPSITPAEMINSQSELIIDNGDAGFGVVNPTDWTPFIGQGYLNDVSFASAGSGSKKAIFKARVPNGVYEVSTTWSVHSNRGTNVPYQILDGSIDEGGLIITNQRASASVGGRPYTIIGGAPFVTIGTITVDSGLLTTVISNNANGYVIADAVRIKRMSAPPPTNQPPTMNTIGNKSVTAGNPLTFTITGSDPEGSPLTCSGSGLPIGALLSGCAFSWTPTTSQVGNHTITFSMSDGSLTDSETITVTVNTTGGGSGSIPAGWTVVKVNSLDAGNGGSATTLSEALEMNIDKKIIVFEVGGNIDLSNWRDPDPRYPLSHYLIIDQPNVIIAGETAPSPGISIINGGLAIVASNVYVRHIRIRLGENIAPNGYSTGDALKINSLGGRQIGNVVVENVSTSWSTDENIEVWMENEATMSPGTIRGVTLKNIISSEGLAVNNNHSHGLLAGNAVQELLIRDSLFAHNYKRNPWFSGRGSSAIVLNNLMYNPVTQVMSVVGGQRGIPGTNLSAINNIVIKGLSSSSQINNRLMYVQRDSSQDANVYLQGNVLLSHYNGSSLGSDWSVSDDSEHVAYYNRSPRSTSYLGWVPRSQLNEKPSNQTVDSVLANAGARPWDRDVVDTRIINNVRNGTGRMITRIGDVGGFPALSETSRVFDPSTFLSVTPEFQLPS